MAQEQMNQAQDKKIELVITTPRGVKFMEKADMVIMRCVDGDLGVLPGHAPVSAALGDGIFRIINDGVEQKLAVFGGIAEIEGNRVNVFSTIAQRPEEIDRERAEADRRLAEATMQEIFETQQIRKLQVLLRHALIRIEVSSHLEEAEYVKHGEHANHEEKNSEEAASQE
ncbi:MAG TPA: ATP synthase F1 subunit epsilon [Limnochordia bacterium]|nr:ATP synthase F1 subunit epsilon [Limnochordia bacterium]HPZ31459.1 ATP synthase F1 subunit epsilon [Limnochordia bacterium]HQD71291.1 ATP synthase F1 subunit epsilon [Limnochordia bacterium]